MIILNSSRNAISQRFTLTHEMIHYLLHAELAHFFCEDDGVSSYEWQANEGAAELLVPYRAFLPAAARFYSIMRTDRLQALQNLSERFGVSVTVIRNRLDSLSYELEQYMNGVPLDQIQVLSRRKLFTAKKMDAAAVRAPSCILDIFAE